jgi:hypothetical protein
MRFQRSYRHGVAAPARFLVVAAKLVFVIGEPLAIIRLSIPA